jgi:hypothetical protein
MTRPVLPLGRPGYPSLLKHKNSETTHGEARLLAAGWGSDMRVPFLDESAWRQFRSKPANQGVNSTTHTALVADAAGVEHRCYVKLLPDPYSPALLCEALGWVLAGHAGLLHPPFGAVVLVPVAKLAACMKLPPAVMAMDRCPAWCAAEIAPGRQVAHGRMKYFDLARERTKLLGTKPARAIAAFDEWTDLQDRNLGNVVVTPKGTYHPIDHETLLFETLWPVGAYTRKTLLTIATASLADDKLKRFKVEMAGAAKGHRPALAAAQTALEEIIEKVFDVPDIPARKTAIMDALTTRAEPDWMSGHLGVIA